MGSILSSNSNQATPTESSVSGSSNKDSLTSACDELDHPNEQFDVADDKKESIKPISAFLLFARDFRQILHNENPGLSFSEKSEKTATAWKELDPKEKEKYHISAKTKNSEMFPKTEKNKECEQRDNQTTDKEFLIADLENNDIQNHQYPENLLILDPKDVRYSESEHCIQVCDIRCILQKYLGQRFLSKTVDDQIVDQLTETYRSMFRSIIDNLRRNESEQPNQEDFSDQTVNEFVKKHPEHKRHFNHFN